MKRREFLSLAGAGAAGWVMRGVLPGAGRAAAAEDAPATRASAGPNVVLIISDDQGWDDYGFMGHPDIRTPNLDRLAAQSLVLPRSYVPDSLCRPSLATMITGLFPHQHKIVGNDPKGGMRDFAGREAIVQQFQKSPALPSLLARKGYRSFQSGKWWEGNFARGGFTAGMTHGDPKRGGRHGDAGLQIGRTGMKPVFDFIDQAAKDRTPFFLWYAPMMPHQPHNPPKRILDKYTAPGRSVHVARYWAMCEWFDETCGQLLDHLVAKGLADNTLVVYICDNGWIQRGDAAAADFARSKRSPYDGGVRTPIMLRWPGHVTPRVDKESLAESIDLAPTILKACGLEPTPQTEGPLGMPGLNLLDAQALARRKAVFGEVYAHNVADLADPVTGLQYRWCVAGRWKLIVPNKPNAPKARVELYDVLADPREAKDLSADHPDKVAELGKLIDRWWPIAARGAAGPAKTQGSSR